MPPPPTPAPARLAIFISGGGRTLLNIADHIATGSINATIATVVASKPCAGVERAQARGLSPRVMPGVIPASALAELFRAERIDYAVLAGYLKFVHIPPGYEHRVINIHPALLPAFGGSGLYGHHVHEAVLAAGCKVSGCTVHLCDSEYDHGPIVLQRTCPVHDDDTPDTLAARVFDLETEAYPAALRLILAGRVQVEGRRTRIAPAPPTPPAPTAATPLNATL